jgi:hypothetical protein
MRGCDSCSAGSGVVEILEDKILIMVFFPILAFEQSIKEIPL